MFDQEINVSVPDQFGLSQKQLNCLQLAGKELLKESGRQDLIEIFISPLDCEISGIGIKNEPPLNWNRGVRLEAVSSESISVSQIQEIFQQQRHCFLYFNGELAPFSSFYKQFPVRHWLMIYDIEDQYFSTFDDSGHRDFYQGVIGKIPIPLCQQLIEENVVLQLAFIKEEVPESEWKHEFLELMRASVLNMRQHGWENLQLFYDRLSRLEVEEMVGRLNELDYTVFFFKKPRELLSLTWQRKLVPQLFSQGKIEHLLREICKHWNIISGYILKWKYVKSRDYRTPILRNLSAAIQLEQAFVSQIEKLLNAEGVRS